MGVGRLVGATFRLTFCLEGAAASFVEGVFGVAQNLSKSSKLYSERSNCLEECEAQKKRFARRRKAPDSRKNLLFHVLYSMYKNGIRVA